MLILCEENWENWWIFQSLSVQNHCYYLELLCFPSSPLSHYNIPLLWLFFLILSCCCMFSVTNFCYRCNLHSFPTLLLLFNFYLLIILEKESVCWDYGNLSTTNRMTTGNPSAILICICYQHVYHIFFLLFTFSEEIDE